VEKEEMTEIRKAARASKTKACPSPSPLAQSLDLPLYTALGIRCCKTFKFTIPKRGLVVKFAGLA